MFAPPITGLGVPVLARARLAPLMTLVVWFWLLLPLLVSLSAVRVAVDAMVAGPGPSARQRTVTLRASAPLPPTAPSVQVMSVAVVGTQLAPAGEADTKVAPAGTVRVRRTLVAASAALLSMPML